MGMPTTLRRLLRYVLAPALALASACENDCVELLAQFFEGHIVANVDVGLETNTFLEHLSEAAIKDVALKFEVRNAVPE